MQPGVLALLFQMLCFRKRNSRQLQVRISGRRHISRVNLLKIALEALSDNRMIAQERQKGRPSSRVRWNRTRPMNSCCPRLRESRASTTSPSLGAEPSAGPEIPRIFNISKTFSQIKHGKAIFTLGALGSAEEEHTMP